MQYHETDLIERRARDQAERRFRRADPILRIPVARRGRGQYRLIIEIGVAGGPDPGLRFLGLGRGEKLGRLRLKLGRARPEASRAIPLFALQAAAYGNVTGA